VGQPQRWLVNRCLPDARNNHVRKGRLASD
jgi:hypothetical protein